LCGDARDRETVNQRRNVINHMISLGYGYSDIAHVMDKDPRGVAYLAKTPAKRKKYHKVTKEHRLAARVDFRKTCNKLGVRTDIIRSHRRDAETVENRAMVAKEMRKIGYSYSLIGHAMNRDHTSVIYLADDQRRGYRRNQMREKHRERMGL
jgi:hypothetical protein